MFKRILVPIDIEHESSWRRTLPAAEHMAEAFGAELHVVAVVPASQSSMVSSYFPADFEQKVMAAANAKARAIVDEHCKNAAGVKTHVAHGSPYAKIIDSADKLGCDAIVISAHRPELRDYLLGSNAAKVVRHSKASVFVIRE